MSRGDCVCGGGGHRGNTRPTALEDVQVWSFEVYFISTLHKSDYVHGRMVYLHMQVQLLKWNRAKLALRVEPPIDQVSLLYLSFPFCFTSITSVKIALGKEQNRVFKSFKRIIPVTRLPLTTPFFF